MEDIHVARTDPASPVWDDCRYQDITAGAQRKILMVYAREDNIRVPHAPPGNVQIQGLGSGHFY